MSSSDWVALGGLLLSCLAFAVSFVAYQLQEKTAKSDNEKELADQIAAVQTHLAEPNFTAQAGYVTAATARAVSQEAIAKASSTNAALQMLVLRVGNLIESTGVTPDWYQNLVLASAAVRIGDQVMASPYVKAAVRLARQPEDRGWNAETAAAAQMLSLQVRANFFYNRGPGAGAAGVPRRGSPSAGGQAACPAAARRDHRQSGLVSLGCRAPGRPLPRGGRP
jgi:hypothetical protein